MNTWSLGHLSNGGFASAPGMAHVGSTFPQYRSHAHATRGKMGTRPSAWPAAKRFRAARRYHAAALRWFSIPATDTSAVGGPASGPSAMNFKDLGEDDLTIPPPAAAPGTPLVILGAAP